jgi:putative Holliday junction resolvase
VSRRVLAIDLGDVRIGLALSDPLGLTAQPLDTLEVGGRRRTLNRVTELVRELDVGTVVVGLPLLLSGEEGDRATAARQWAAELEARIPGVQVQLWDERLTTAEAERTMISGDVRRRARRSKVDQVAAALILQGYLDSRGGPDGGKSG